MATPGPAAGGAIATVGVGAGPAPAAAAAGVATTTKKKSSSDFLKLIAGRSVVVKLNSGYEYRGVLACMDGFMNVAMEQTEEFKDGQLQSRLGDCFFRGNNVFYIGIDSSSSSKATAS